jgi:hypothetical protein
LIHIGKNTKLMKNCPKTGWPAGATEKNIFVQVIDIRGSCNTVLQPGVSLATDRKKMSCGQTAELVDSANANFSQRVRADTCFGCEPKQIDAYVAIDSCKGKDVGDLGDYWTMILD